MSTDAGHTPGPWVAVETLAAIEIMAPADVLGERRVARTGPGHANAANARLIARAPALLVACEEAYEWLRDGVEDPDTRRKTLDKKDGYAGLLFGLRAAIRAARGE